jgi:hypothetical protein
VYQTSISVKTFINNCLDVLGTTREKFADTIQQDDAVARRVFDKLNTLSKAEYWPQFALDRAAIEPEILRQWSISFSVGSTVRDTLCQLDMVCTDPPKQFDPGEAVWRSSLYGRPFNERHPLWNQTPVYITQTSLEQAPFKRELHPAERAATAVILSIKRLLSGSLSAEVKTRQESQE